MSARTRETEASAAFFEAANAAAADGRFNEALRSALRVLCHEADATHGEMSWRGLVEQDVAIGDGVRPRTPPASIALRLAGMPRGEARVWRQDGSAIDLAEVAERLVWPLHCAELTHERDQQSAWRAATTIAVKDVSDALATERPGRALMIAARRLLNAPAAMFFSPDGVEHDGVYRADDLDVNDLVPEPLRTLGIGETWNGTTHVRPLMKQGYRAGLAVCLGPEPGEAVLLLLGTDGDFGAAEEAVLREFGFTAKAVLDSAARADAAPRLVDPETGLPDQRYFIERLTQETSRAERHLRSVSVLVLALDASGFGQLSSDLWTLAEMAASEVRSSDVPCRIATDHIGVILPDVETMDAVLIADRLRAKVRESEDYSGPTTLSVGTATFPARAGSASELREAATRALGWARSSGADRTFVYEREIAATLDDTAVGTTERGAAIADSLRLLADSVDGRRGATGHATRVARIAREISRKLGLPADRSERVYVAALLHDIGQISMDDGILNSPGPLTGADVTNMRAHPDIGSRLLAGTPFADLRDWIRHHHERVDGTGYPDRLSEESIPIEAQIISVAEAFEEMTSDRPYRHAFRVEDALDEIRRGSGSQFSRSVVEALDAVLNEDQAESEYGRSDGHR